MKRTVDMLISPAWLANFFGVKLAGPPRFDPEAPGESANGQLRVPVWADVADDVTEVVGVVEACEATATAPADLARVKAINPRAEIVRWIQGNGVKDWRVARRELSPPSRIPR